MINPTMSLPKTIQDTFEAQFILYDPKDLAEVAAGRIKPLEPQPYASVRLDNHLFLNASQNAYIGNGKQRHHRIGAVTYDRRSDLLYVMEPHADGSKPVVHVWRVR
jgi:cytochrome oxidase Cu insertion factor (SCO1/SenC/PrrC family)